MIKNYVTLALRNLRKQKGYAAVNVLGLSIGIACCLLIALFVRQELSYDRYHEHADRIYRLTTLAGISEGGTHFAAAAPPMARIMREEFPEVIASTRVIPSSAIVTVGDRTFREDRFYFADSTLFDVFTFPLLEGSGRTVLASPNSVVLTRRIAEKYFGGEGAIGRTIRVDDDGEYVVSGVVENVPVESHFRFDLLASTASLSLQDDGGPETWVSNIGNYTYVLLDEGASAADVERRLGELVEANVGPLLDDFGATLSLHLQPLSRIHLHSALTAEIEPTSDIAYVYIFGSAAIFLLLIACFNFVNLATARSVERAREVGMRKVLGAARAQIVRQFLVEATLLASAAVLLAVVAVRASLPLVESVTGYSLTLEFGDDAPLLAGLAVVMLLVGLLAGSYPALVLSAFRPIEVLKGRFRPSASGVSLRKFLVVAQFAISIVLIAGTAVVTKQLEYARAQKRGFSSEQVLVAPLPSELQPSLSALKSDLQRRTGVIDVSAADHFPGGPINDAVHIPEGATDDEGIHFWRYNVDFGFTDVLDMELVEGRSFSRPADSSAFLINETAARAIGWADPVGRTLYELPSSDVSIRLPRRVIGVVRDFHFESIRNEIKPLIIAVDPRPSYLLVKVQPTAIPQTVSFLQDRWASTAVPLDYFFLDSRFDAMYQSEARLGRVFRVFAGLAIVIACLGLFALSTYTVQQRTKEIGVRKVLGASVPSIVAGLSRSFLALVALGFVVAAPIAYLASTLWLREFAYRVEPGVAPFLIAGGAALLVGFGTISIQSVRAALADPVETLRYE